jgi:hypothetical protein
MDRVPIESPLRGHDIGGAGAVATDALRPMGALLPVGALSAFTHDPPVVLRVGVALSGHHQHV